MFFYQTSFVFFKNQMQNQMTGQMNPQMGIQNTLPQQMNQMGATPMGPGQLQQQMGHLQRKVDIKY